MNATNNKVPVGRCLMRETMKKRVDLVGHNATVVVAVREAPCLRGCCLCRPTARRARANASLSRRIFFFLFFLLPPPPPFAQRACPRLLTYSERNAEQPKPHAALALGSSEGTVSVWLAGIKRPLVVVHDLFTGSVLDISWSRTGVLRQGAGNDARGSSLTLAPAQPGHELVVSSMDGSVACLRLEEAEIGRFLNQKEAER